MNSDMPFIKLSLYAMPGCSSYDTQHQEPACEPAFMQEVHIDYRAVS